MRLRDNLHHFLRNQTGSAAFEAVFLIALLLAIVPVTTFLFSISSVGVQSATDNRTVGRNAALNASCTRSGIIAGLDQTSGLREKSVVLIRCEDDLNGESALSEGDRFWQSVVDASNPDWPGINVRQKDHFEFAIVRARQITTFAPSMNLGTDITPISYSNSAFIPVPETWRYNDDHWAEGHDVVIWNRLSGPQQQLFPHVYPSANPRPQTQSEPLREFDELQSPEDICEKFFDPPEGGSSITAETGDDPFADASSGKDAPSGNDDNDETQVRAETELFGTSGEVKKIRNPTREGDYVKCVQQTFGAYNASLSVYAEWDWWDWELPDIGVDLEIGGTAYEYKAAVINEVTGSITEYGVKVGDVSVNFELEADVADINTDEEILEGGIGAEATGVKGHIKHCPGALPNACAQIEVSILKGEVSLEDKPTAAAGSVKVSGEGTFTIRGHTFTIQGEVEIAVGPAPKISGGVNIDKESQDALINLAKDLATDPWK